MLRRPLNTGWRDSGFRPRAAAAPRVAGDAKRESGAEMPFRESRRWTAGLVEVEVEAEAEAEAEAEVAGGWSACSAEACSCASDMP